MMTRMLRISAAVFVCMFLLAACDAKSNVPESVSQSAQQSAAFSETPALQAATPSPSAQPTSPAEIIQPDISADIYDYMVAINGDAFTLPMPYSDVESMGWTSSSSNELVAGRSVYGTSLTKGEVDLPATIINFDVRARPMNECYLYAINIPYSSEDVNYDDVAFMLPGGLKSGDATIEDALAAHAEPTEDGGTYLIYRQKDYYISHVKCEVHLSFGSENKLQSFYMENATQPEGFEYSPLAAEPPKYVKNYTAPAQLSDDLDDYAFQLDGKMYKLPLPLSELLDDGWELRSKGIGYLPSYWNFIIPLRKGDTLMHGMVANTCAEALPIEDCMLFSLNYEGGDMQIAKGIKIGSDEDEVRQALKGVLDDDDLAKSSKQFWIRDKDDWYTSKYRIELKTLNTRKTATP